MDWVVRTGLQSSLIKDEFLQLINGISNDLQKLLKYFNETTILVSSTELVSSLWFAVVFPTRAALDLNVWELLIVKSAFIAETSSLLNCHKLLDVSE